MSRFLISYANPAHQRIEFLNEIGLLDLFFYLLQCGQLSSGGLKW